jgi:hypothetical protein
MHRSIDVGAGEGVVIDVADDVGFTLSTRCSSAPSQWYALVGSASGTRGTRWVDLPPGSYTLFAEAARYDSSGVVDDGALALTAKLPSDLRLLRRLTTNVVASRCNAGTTVTLNTDATTYVDLVNGVTDGWISVDGGGRDYYLLWLNLAWSGDNSQPLLVCDSCSPGAVCAPPSTTSPIRLSAGAVIHLQNVSPDLQTATGRLVFSPASAANDAGR